MFEAGIGTQQVIHIYTVVSWTSSAALYLTQFSCTNSSAAFRKVYTKQVFALPFLSLCYECNPGNFLPECALSWTTIEFHSSY